MVSVRKLKKYVSKKSDFVVNVVKKTKKSNTLENVMPQEHLETKSMPQLPTSNFDLHSSPATKPRRFKSESERKKWEEKLFKVKPYGYYPSSTYMTEKEIHVEMLKPSTFVKHCIGDSFAKIDEGMMNKESCDCLSCSEIYNRFGIKTPSNNDNRIGSLLVEVLGCVRLPKPNTFVYLLCGDSAFSTDVIPSVHSPKWPCRSRRAALFPIHHAFVRLYVGVFNVEEKKTVNDKFAGRVVVDLSVLKPNTVYDVTLPLRESANVYSCKPRYAISNLKIVCTFLTMFFIV